MGRERRSLPRRLGTLPAARQLGGDHLAIEPVELDYDHHRSDLEQVNGTYEKLRGACPVGHTAAHGGYYLVGSLEAARTAAGDWQTFSSAGGTRLPKAPFRIAAIEFDPPEHDYWRGLYREVMNLSTYRSFEERVANHVARLVDRLASAGRADLYEQLSEPLPVITVCEVVGLTDPERQREVRRIALALYEAQSNPAAFPAAFEAFRVFCIREIEARRQAPKDDFLTRLATQPADGELISDDKIFNLLIGFLVAGHHSTSSAMSSLLYHVAADAGLRDRLAADLSLLPRAIEETVRLDTPLHAFFRQTTRDVEVAGVPIPAGSEVMLNYAAANRDPAGFERPLEFDIDRPKNNHLGFGHGIHSCVGAQLARLELRLAVTEVLRRLPDLRLVPDGVHRLWRGGNLYQIDRLEVEFTPQ